MFHYLFLSFLATVLAHGDRETYTKICGGMRRGVSVFYKGVPTSELFSLTLYDQRKGSCGRKTDFSRSIRPFYAAHIGRFPMDLRKNNSIFLAYGGPEGRRFAKSSYFDQPEPRDDRKFTIEIRMVNDTCARYYVDKNEVGDVCNRYFRDANCLVSSNGVDIRRHWVKGDPGCSQEADDNSYSRSDDNSRYDDDDDDDSDDRSDSSRGRRRGRRSASLAYCVTSGEWYLMPVCGRLEPGMKVRFYASVFRTEWIIQLHVNRETQCYNGKMDLNTDRPFHVNHYFVHPQIPAHNRQFAVVAGPANSWDFYHWVDMRSDIQQNQFIQADVIVVKGGFDYFANGNYIASAMSNYATEKVDCVLATMDANVPYKWIEGQPNCPYRANDTIRPGFEPTTEAPPTTTTSSSSQSPTGSTPRPTPPPYFPPPGWPYCIPPFCYPYITFPCHPMCYTNCPVYCPPACYVVPGYGYQPPPVYPPCNLANLPTCLPYYGVPPYEAVPAAYVAPQCHYLPGIWPWIHWYLPNNAINSINRKHRNLAANSVNSLHCLDCVYPVHSKHRKHTINPQHGFYAKFPNNFSNFEPDAVHINIANPHDNLNTSSWLFNVPISAASRALTYYFLPVCGRLTPGMKVRFYTSIVTMPAWIIQIQVGRETTCTEGIDLNTDRPFHVNHNFTAGEYALATGPSDSWIYTHVYHMNGEIAPNVFFQADIHVIEGGYQYYINGKLIDTVMSPYSNEKADCIIGTHEANVPYKWIEGQPNCPYRSGDTIRPGYYTTPVPTTSLSPTVSTPQPTPPPYFPPPGWPYCIAPYCYPYITFPCHPMCYTNCPVYCPPACYVVPGYGYQPPPVYPPCNLANLPTCLPYYGVAPYSPAPAGYVWPQYDGFSAFHSIYSIYSICYNVHTVHMEYSKLANNLLAMVDISLANNFVLLVHNLVYLAHGLFYLATLYDPVKFADPLNI
ncbi:unnamed protein product [Bursaphelenchus xylophilus]|uniref:(pine wood nematode) hypothetical protein n=1 Tax=Bursaphelenchus xylophilus TaxID=6326 RepID=A0A7I8X9A3_BURXY|nr:unnamed protein product [Bursaphelenchus xylophilus]CAG9125674.1 unnamed protein product [Bursaphelenchus xylophilus]